MGAFLKNTRCWVLFLRGGGKSTQKKHPAKKAPAAKKSTQALVSYYLGVLGAKAAERPRCLW